MTGDPIIKIINWADSQSDVMTLFRYLVEVCQKTEVECRWAGGKYRDTAKGFVPKSLRDMSLELKIPQKRIRIILSRLSDVRLIKYNRTVKTVSVINVERYL